MNAIDQFRLNADSYLEVSSTDFTRQVMATPPSVAVSCFDNKLLGTFRVSLAIGGALIASGIYHLVLLWMTSADWSGPVSLRKPGLFGVSAGMTVWSIAWVLTQLVPRRNDPLFATLLSVGLLLEVGFITMQQWRGVPSHFNRTTPFDATIESIMLGLILLVTVGIAWLVAALVFRWFGFPDHDRRPDQYCCRPVTRELGQSRRPEISTWSRAACYTGTTAFIPLPSRMANLIRRSSNSIGGCSPSPVSDACSLANLQRSRAMGY